MNQQSKKVLLGAATIAAVAGVAPSAFAADTAKVQIDARIVQAIAITAGNALDFGTASVAAATAGTIVVGPDSARAAGGAGGVTLVGATSQAGTFTVKAAANVAYDVTLPATVSITDTGSAANKMQVNGFNWDPTTAAGATGSAFPLAATPTGATVVYALGGTLNVAAGQTPGIFTGTVTLTASYQ